MPKIDSIIFDLDGTLWDASAGVLDAWNDLIQKEGLSMRISEKQIQGVMGLSFEDLAAKLFPGLEREERLALVERCYVAETEYLHDHGAILYPKLEETLRELAREYPLFVVSNCQKNYIEAFYHSHGLGGYFRDRECSGNTGLSKGKNIRLLADRNHLFHPIYVGDIRGDLRASEEAGIPFLYARYGYGDLTPEEYTYYVDAFGELPACLRQITEN